MKTTLQQLTQWLTIQKHSLFGYNTYTNDQHITHEPSWLQRRKARKASQNWINDQIQQTIAHNFPPPARLIYESDGLPSQLCPTCGSSLHRKFNLGSIHLFKTTHCIQPTCNNSTQTQETP